MEDKQKLLTGLEKAVREHNSEELNRCLGAAFETAIVEDELRLALFRGLERQRRRMMTDDVPVPHFLLSLDTVHEGFKRISLHLGREPGHGTPLVIGVVEGDPHDLGKNIIAKVYEASSYRVYDLGREVSVDAFIRNVQEKEAKVLALSAMMSTTMAMMPEIIRRVKEETPGTVIMVGGAPLDTALAKSFGADGYAESAVTLLEQTEAAIERVSAGEPW